MESARNFVMFDLDGCIANDQWRIGLIPENPTEGHHWNEYHSKCHEDTPLEHGAAILRDHIEKGHAILFTTARPMSVAKKTSDWITQHFGITSDEHFAILMRQDHDVRGALPLKEDFAKYAIELAKKTGVSIVGAYDDREDIVNMYRTYDINAWVLNADGMQVWKAPPDHVSKRLEQTLPMGNGVPQNPTVPDHLVAAANLYRERNMVYKDNYKRVGAVYLAMFPDGATLKTERDFNRFTLFMMLVHKLNRYAFSFDKPHGDSLDDLAVYSMMLKEVDNDQPSI